MAWIARWQRWSVLAACLAWGGVAAAQDAAVAPREAAAPHAMSRTYVRQNLFIPEGQQVKNVLCLFCSVQIEGDVTGRVVVLFGNLSVAGRVGGDALVLDGNAIFDVRAHIVGDTVVLLGNAIYEGANVFSGAAYVLGGHAPSFDTSQKTRRRFSLSPVTLTLLALLGLGLVVGVVAAGARRRYAAGSATTG